jgi:hypothetical protein
MSTKLAKASHLGCNDRTLMLTSTSQFGKATTSRVEGKGYQGMEAIVSYRRDLSILQSVLTLGRR